MTAREDVSGQYFSSWRCKHTNKQKTEQNCIASTEAQHSVCLQNKLFRFCFSKTCLVDGFLCLSFLLCWRRIQIEKALICSQILEKLQSLKTSGIRWWWTLLFLKSSETYSAKLTWFWKLKNIRARHGYLPKKNAKFYWLSKCNWTTEIDASLKFREPIIEICLWSHY